MTGTMYRLIQRLNKSDGFYKGMRLNAFGATVQLWHETGGFRHVPYHNYAGIKYRDWHAKYGITRVGLMTNEEVGGVSKRLSQDFAVFKDDAHFLWFYSRLIRRLYPMSANNPDCVWLFFQGLKLDHGYQWATDSHYLGKLTQVAMKLAPDLLPPTWMGTLRQSFMAARERGGMTASFDALVAKELQI